MLKKNLWKIISSSFAFYMSSFMFGLFIALNFCLAIFWGIKNLLNYYFLIVFLFCLVTLIVTVALSKIFLISRFWATVQAVYSAFFGIVVVVYILLKKFSAKFYTLSLLENCVSSLRMVFLICLVLGLFVSAYLLSRSDKVDASRNAFSFSMQPKRAILFLFLGWLSMFLINYHNLFILIFGLDVLSFLFLSMSALAARSKLFVVYLTKYVCLFLTSSALSVFGLSLIFYTTKSLDLLTLRESSAVVFKETGGGRAMLLSIGYILVTQKLLFLLGLFPFHFYGGEFPAVLNFAQLYIFFIPIKLVYTFHILLLFKNIFWLSIPCRYFIFVSGFSSVFLGAVGAFNTMRIRAFVGLSSINQFGLIGVLISLCSDAGFCAALAVFFTYYVGLSGVLVLFNLAEVNYASHLDSASEGFWSVANWRESSKFATFYEISLLLFLLSLAGVPPLPGFWAKFYLFSALLTANAYWPLFVISLLTVVSFYYYFNIALKVTRGWRVFKTQYPTYPRFTVSVSRVDILVIICHLVVLMLFSAAGVSGSLAKIFLSIAILF